ncbi:MAG: GNAT family N-acetyltransferase [Lachnospiraceae bacterium]|nr:GNAT family N-acetyltransferase [Lachnospiraceae bacterium]
MLKELASRLIIKRAEYKDIHIIEDILNDAICWMNINKIPNLWSHENVSWNNLSKSYDIDDFYIAYITEQPVGCMAITDEDKMYWKKDKVGEALYLHKLAVKQNFRGIGVSSELINYAKQITISSGVKLLKLDCNAERLKLRKIYQSNGFKLVDIIYMDNNYKMALYVMDVT